MAIDWFSDILLDDRIKKQNEYWMDRELPEKSQNWSFTEEWADHLDQVGDITWDYTANDRVRQFYMETQIDQANISGKILLDAGCGNGLLTQALSFAGAKAVGVDLQQHLPGYLSSDSLQFILADFLHLPFKKQCFDVVIANGSLHHTPDTRKSFLKVAEHIKIGGRFYVWLYKRPTGFKENFLLLILDLTRTIICRLPTKAQYMIVNWFTSFFFWLSRKRNGINTNRTREQIRVNIFDAFTPLHRNYHRPEEVAQWFHESGFDSIQLTHWDNQYGFGMVGQRNFPGLNTPGENFK